MKRKELEGFIDGFIAGLRGLGDIPGQAVPFSGNLSEFHRGMGKGEATRSSILSAAQQQGNENCTCPPGRRLAHIADCPAHPDYGSEQADERCPECDLCFGTGKRRVKWECPDGYEQHVQFHKTDPCPRCGGTGKKPTQEEPGSLVWVAPEDLERQQRRITELESRALAAERERDELRRAAQMAQGQAEHFRQLDEANYQLRVKYRKAIERHRDSGTASPQYDHNRELWAVLEGESE